jgi:predicted phosphate transport protein (TIGR00153 family)
MDMAYREITLAIDTVTELEKAIVAASKKDTGEATKAIERLFVVETEIDELRRSVFEELTRGSLPPKDREDIMHLVKRLDTMADHVKDAGRSLKLLLDVPIPKEICSELLEIVKDLVLESATLRKSIEKLGVDVVEVRALAKKVDDIETRVDERYLRVKAMLLKYGREMDAAALLILMDLLQSLEEVADCSDDTADYVRILTVTREAD